MNATSLAQGHGQRATDSTKFGPSGLKPPTPQVPRNATTHKPRGQRATNPKDTGTTGVADPTSQASKNDGTRNEQLTQHNDANAVPMNVIARAPANSPVHEERTQELNNDPRLSVAAPFVSVRKAHALNKSLGPDGPTAGLKAKKISRREERQVDKVTFRRLQKDTRHRMFLTEQLIFVDAPSTDKPEGIEGNAVAPKQFSKGPIRRLEAERKQEQRKQGTDDQNGQLLITSQRDQKKAAQLGWKGKEKKRQKERAADRG